jgi:cob(I)alamin adenosyltransferase
MRRATTTRADDGPESLVFLNMGAGRGKSTAALGMVLRTLSRDRRVCFVQFFRPPGVAPVDELVCRRLGVEWVDGLRGTGDERAGVSSSNRADAAWQRARRALAGGHYGLVVLDEISHPLAQGWLAVEEVVEGITSRALHVSVVMTCRRAPEELVRVSDVVTEMTPHHAL